MNYELTAHELAAATRTTPPTWPPAPHTVIALFSDYRAAAVAAEAVRERRPEIEPAIVRTATETPFAGTGQATLMLRTREDAAVARDLAAAEGVRRVYRAGAWTNETIAPRLA